MINLMFNPMCCSSKWEVFQTLFCLSLCTRAPHRVGEDDDEELCPPMRGVVIGVPSVLHSHSSECCHQSKTLLGWIQVKGNLCLIMEKRVVYLETLSIVCADIIRVYKTVIN